MDNFLEQLEKLKENKTNSFGVPEGYFDTLPSRIQDRIAASDEKKNVFNQILIILKPQLAFAAAFVTLALISIFTLEYVFKDQTKLPVSNGIYTRIIEVDASEFNEQHFIDVLLDENNTKSIDKEKNSENYIDFLVDENIDYMTIIDEL